jgi:hypothetical protein
MASGHVFYCVVTPEGKPRRRRTRKGQGSGTLMIYSELGGAKKQCRDGDAVMEMTLDLGREPLFIKGMVLDGGADEED